MLNCARLCPRSPLHGNKLQLHSHKLGQLYPDKCCNDLTLTRFLHPRSQPTLPPPKFANDRLLQLAACKTLGAPRCHSQFCTRNAEGARAPCNPSLFCCRDQKETFCVPGWRVMQGLLFHVGARVAGKRNCLSMRKTLSLCLCLHAAHGREPPKELPAGTKCRKGTTSCTRTRTVGHAECSQSHMLNAHTSRNRLLQNKLQCQRKASN